jgi:hypothetical protein
MELLPLNNFLVFVMLGSAATMPLPNCKLKVYLKWGYKAEHKCILPARIASSSC